VVKVMRLVFKKSLHEKLIDMVSEAEEQMKDIEKIVLTQKEYDELRKDVCWPAIGILHFEFFLGYPVEVENERGQG